MNWLMDLVPVWLPLSLVVLGILASIVLHIVDTAEEIGYDPERVVNVGTYRLTFEVPDTAIDDEKVRIVANKVRREIEAVIKDGRLWYPLYPHLHLAAIRRGSILFEYDIYVLRSAGFTLVDYSGMKAGLEDILKNPSSIGTAIRKASSRWAERLKKTELRMMPDHEVDDLFRRNRAQETRERVLVPAEKERRSRY